MDSRNDISDEYRRVMIEGLEEISRLEHIPKLGEFLRTVIQELVMLDKQLQQAHEMIRKVASKNTIR
jgi:hypothetical protein